MPALQDMAHKAAGMLRIPPSGCAASAWLRCQGDRRVNSPGTESRVAMGEPRQALKHKTERNKSNHRILRGDADG